MKTLTKGTEIVCPSCKKVMCRLNRDLSSGMKIKASYFDAVEYQPIPHTNMDCPFDGSHLFFLGSLHTKDGWN